MKVPVFILPIFLFWFSLQVAFLAGCLYTLVGVLRLGWVIRFLSHSVIHGFTTGASVIIGLSQVPQTLNPDLKPRPQTQELQTQEPQTQDLNPRPQTQDLKPKTQTQDPKTLNVKPIPET